MKCALLGVILAGGTLASAQSGAPAVATPRGLFAENHPPLLSGKDLLTSPLLLYQERSGMFGFPPPARENRLGDASIDPQILLRPTGRSLGTPAPGMQIAQNQFPGLTLLPIDTPQPSAAPLATVFPNLRIELIPTDCSRVRNLLVESRRPDSSRK